MIGTVHLWQAADGESSELRLGWVQMDIAWEKPQANISFLEDLWKKVGQAAEVWVLSEMWATGFSVSAREAETEPGPALQAMQHWAARHQALFIGSLKVRDSEGRLYNRAYAVSPSGRWRAYDKRHLFRMAGEEKLFTAGRDRLLIIYKGWRIALQVCYDLRFPVWSRRTQNYDYDLLVYVANWPSVRAAHWQRLLPARAIENQAYVLGVNRVGADGTGKSYKGASGLYSPLGEGILLSGETQGAFWQTLSKASVQGYRMAFPAWQDADDFDFKPHP